MNTRRLLAALLALATCLSLAPPLRAARLPSSTPDAKASIQAAPPAPLNAASERRGGRVGGHTTGMLGAFWNRWLEVSRAWWLLLAFLLPCLVLGGGARLARADDWISRIRMRTAVEETGRTPQDTILVSGEEKGGGWGSDVPPPPPTWCIHSKNRPIPVAPIEEYPRIPDLDNDDPNSLFNTWRPNLFGIDVPPEWDFQNLINTDRPDFTDATFTVGEGVVLLESGYTFRRSETEGIHLQRRQLPETLLRVGVTDELELRIKWVGYVITDVQDQTTGLGTSHYGTDDLQLAFKYELSQQDGWRPIFTFLGGAIIPSGTRGVSSNQVQPFANLVYGWGIRRWLYLKGSTGVDFAKTSDITRVVEGSLQEGPTALDVEDNISQWHQSFSLLYQASPRVGGFVEWFSFFSNNGADNRASHYADTGIFYYLSPNVQLDARVGWRLSSQVDTLFTGAGFSTRW